MGGQLAYFPSLYPDEIIYSVLARCRRHLGFPAYGQVAEMMSLGSSRQRTTALMVHIGTLAACLPSDRNLTASRLLRRHTLFPYLTAGRSLETRHNVAQGMIHGSPQLYQRLGLRNHIPRPLMLRFCPQCLVTMASSYGELYWRRSHQLPAVFVCPDHGCELLESNVKPGAAGGGWIAATRENCPASAKSALPRDASRNLNDLRELAIDSMSLLMDPRRNAPSCTRAGAQLFEALSYKGYVLSSGVLPWRHLRAVVTARLVFLRPLSPRLFDRRGLCGKWLLDILSARRTGLDPILYVLASKFVDSLPDVSSARFGEGPWPCQNPVAAHVGLPVIHTLHHHRRNERLIGLFKCQCGYSYERTVSEDRVVSKPRMITFGETLLPVLTKAFEEGWTEYRVCRETRTSAASLRNAALKLGIRLPRPFRPIYWTQEYVAPGAKGFVVSASGGVGDPEGWFWLSDAQWKWIAQLGLGRI